MYVWKIQDYVKLTSLYTSKLAHLNLIFKHTC